MLLAEIVATSNALAATTARTEKVSMLSDVLSRVDPDGEPAVAISFLSGSPTQRRLGVGYATVYGIEVAPAVASTLDLVAVDGILEEISKVSGPGSKARRDALLKELMSRATEPEQEYLRGLLVRNVRQGAQEGLMADALAEALGVNPNRIRRSAMLEGDLVAVGARAFKEGVESLGAAALSVFTPVQPMLAKTAASVAEAVDGIGRAIVENKLDGLRLQVHRSGERVAIFTRNLRDVTPSLPRVVEGALILEADQFILDGEGLMVGPEGRPFPFQDSMSRSEEDGENQLSAFYFDVLHREGVDLIDEDLEIRHRVLEEMVPEGQRVRSTMTGDQSEAQSFFDEAVAAGFEGVVIKDPTQPYEAGRRGSGWMKVKPTHTLDLVILAAEWGSGRRQGWLSNLHLGARGSDGDFVMLGKTFKGLTDEILAWQTTAFQEIEVRRDRRTVFVEPRLVYEIAFDGVQRSTRYPGGVALRFARVKRVRKDKTPEEVDSLETVRSYLR